MRRARWIWPITAAVLLVNGLRLRRRLQALPVVAPADAPVAERFRFVTAQGVALDDATRRAAAAHAEAKGLQVLDLVPGDLPAEQALDLARMVDPRTYRTKRTAVGRGAGHALVVDAQVLDDARIERVTGLDPVAMLRVTATLKRHAAVTDDLAVLPSLSAVDDDSAKRLAVLRSMFAIGTPIVLGASLTELVILTAGAILQPWWGAAAIAAYTVQPAVALAGTPVAPRDLSVRSILRLPSAWATWVRTVAGRWRPDVDEPIDELRREYDDMLSGGLDHFFEPRRPDCPVCSSTALVVKLRTPDLQQGKPGEFVLEECTACGHIFQNPRLSLEGLDFYQKDFYDGLAEESLEFAFGAGGDSYEDRARMLEGHGEPKRWLDVGAGHGHFCLVAREVWPDTVFDGVDLSDSIESAERRRWVDQGYRGLFPDLADDLAGQYDVVSMHHYLEHARDPFEEIEAAGRVLAPGGHLLIEVPDPSSTFNRMLGSHWVPWFQPQHQHLLSIENLEWALGERGFTPMVEHRGEAHQPVDLVFAVYMMINRLAPPTDLPWRPPATRRARVRRAVAFTAGVPFLAGAVALDHLLAVGVRRGRRSNTYRVLARRDEVSLPDEKATIIDLREPVAVS